jgi:hypothetical protein
MKNIDNAEMQEIYAEFIMERAAGERLICNGDMLVDAMEDGYLLEEFLETK